MIAVIKYQDSLVLAEQYTLLLNHVNLNGWILPNGDHVLDEEVIIIKCLGNLDMVTAVKYYPEYWV